MKYFKFNLITVLILTLTLIHSAEAKRKKNSGAKPALNAELTPISTYQAKQTLLLVNPDADSESLIGTWVLTMATDLAVADNDIGGYSSPQGLYNADGSMRKIQFYKSTGNEWLPEGENSEIRVLDENILVKGNSHTSRVDINGGTVEYKREIFALTKKGKKYHDDQYSEYEYARNLHRVFDSSELVKLSYRTVYNKTKISCGLLSHDSNKLVCLSGNGTLSEVIELLRRQGNNDIFYSRYTQQNFILGFSRVEQ